MDKNKGFMDMLNKKSPSDLNQIILRRISKEEIKLVKRRFFFTSTLTIISVVSLIPAFMYLSSEISKSGFYQYAKLLISDTSSIFIYWKELSYSLVESAPMLGSLIVLILIFVTLSSLRELFKSQKILSTKIQLA